MVNKCPLPPTPKVSLSLLAFTTNPLVTCGGQLLENTKWKQFLISDSGPEVVGCGRSRREQNSWFSYESDTVHLTRHKAIPKESSHSDDPRLPPYHQIALNRMKHTICEALLILMGSQPMLRATLGNRIDDHSKVRN